MDFKIIHQTHTPQQAVELLLDIFDDNREYAKCCLLMMKSQIPMYIGNLNPLWEYWDNVATILFKTSNQDVQKQSIYLTNRIKDEG